MMYDVIKKVKLLWFVVEIYYILMMMLSAKKNIPTMRCSKRNIWSVYGSHPDVVKNYKVRLRSDGK